MNHLYFGDCLDVLRDLKENFPQPFIDLIYIDPPFNSKRNYNVLFESMDMKDANAQKQAFADTWTNVAYMDELHMLAEMNKTCMMYSQHLAKQKVSITVLLLILLPWLYEFTTCINS